MKMPFSEEPNTRFTNPPYDSEVKPAPSEETRGTCDAAAFVALRLSDATLSCAIGGSRHELALDLRRLLTEFGKPVAPEAVGRETREQVEQEIIIECSSDMEHTVERRFSTGYRTVMGNVWNALINARMELFTLRRELALFQAKDQCLPPGFCIGDDLSAEFAIKIVELESQVRELTAQRDQLREKNRDFNRRNQALTHAVNVQSERGRWHKYYLAAIRLFDDAEKEIAELRATIERLEPALKQYAEGMTDGGYLGSRVLGDLADRRKGL